MSFTVFTDGFSNLPGSALNGRGISILPSTYYVDGRPVEYDGDVDRFDAHGYYDSLRAGTEVRTSLVNAQAFQDAFLPALQRGEDIVYVGLSSAVSGTYQAAVMAAQTLSQQFPERTIRTVDSKGAGLGTGILTLRAADLRDQGRNAREAAQALEGEVKNLCQYFTVDDLMFLRRTGRLSTAGALMGTLLGIKPLLWGDETGHIVMLSKCRGRKKAIDTIAEIYARKVVAPEQGRVAISHGDCPEDAQTLADKITALAKPKELIVCPHEPFTGSHVGPGMLAVYFFGDGR